MGIKNHEIRDSERKLILEVIENVRKQEYTPEKLCQLQKILETQYYYWWINDMKVEERAKHLFTEEFECFAGTGSYINNPLNWARNGKYINSFMNTAHMGHNPMVWLIDDSHARGVFFFESYMTYLDNPEEACELFYIYVNDFVKGDNGLWLIEKYRLVGTKTIGALRPNTFRAPEDYAIENWDNY